MKPKRLFLMLFVVTILLSGWAYLHNDKFLAGLTLLMALASALNASRPEAGKN